MQGAAFHSPSPILDTPPTSLASSLMGTVFTTHLWHGKAEEGVFVPRRSGIVADAGGRRGNPQPRTPNCTNTWRQFPGCLGMAASSSRTQEGPWVQNLVAMGTRALGEDAQSIL